MQATANGVVSGIQSGDAITQIEIVWMATSGGTPSETQAAAQAAGRAVTLTSSTDVAAFQAGGYTIVSSAIVVGQQYTPSVRVTESRGGSGSYVGGWTNGTYFTGTTTTTTTTTTTAGPVSITFDTFASGTGAVTTPGGGIAYQLSSPASGDFSNMVYATGLTQTAHTFKTHFKTTGMAGNSGYVSTFRPGAISGATSKPTNRGACFTPYQLIDPVLRYNGSYSMYLEYVAAGVVPMYWDGSAWATTQYFFTGFAANTLYTYILETTTTQFRMTIKSGDETSTIIQTAWVNWSALASQPSDMYMFTDLYNALGGSTVGQFTDYTKL